MPKALVNFCAHTQRQGLVSSGSSKIDYILKACDYRRNLFLCAYPVLRGRFRPDLPCGRLTISSEGLSAGEIAGIVLSIFGTLDGAKLGSVEVTVDVHGLPMSYVEKAIAAPRKRRYDDWTYKGETVYLGAPRSTHQTRIYDKGLQLRHAGPTTYVRYEARLRFVGRKQPDLVDWLSGAYALKEPFRHFMLVDLSKLWPHLTSRERAYVGRWGLHRLLTGMPMSDRRRRKLRKIARANLLVDFNQVHADWARGWHGKFTVAAQSGSTAA